MEYTVKRIARKLHINCDDLEQVCKEVKVNNTVCVAHLEQIERYGVPIWRELSELFKCDMERVYELGHRNLITVRHLKAAFHNFSKLIN